MDAKQFELSTKTISNLIVEYMETLPHINLANNVTPGFLEKNLEKQCSINGSHFVEIGRDLTTILNGIQHQSSPHFHSDYPMGNSYISMIAELLTAGINNVSLNWEASPAATELEVIVLNWLAKMLQLPEEFYHGSSNGGGVLQNTCSEAMLLSLLSARTRAIENHRVANNKDTHDIIQKLVFYSSNLAQETPQLLSTITTIKVRYLEANSEGKITSEVLRTAFETDSEKGLIPCMYISTMGTESLMSYDDLTEIGPICKEYNVWLHINANYAGMLLICPEFRAMNQGIEYADSITVGIHRFLMTHDVVGYWNKDGRLLTAALSVDPLYLRHKHVGSTHDYMNWQIGTGRKFKALKVWMTLKSYGLEGMQDVIRKHVKMAATFGGFIKKDNRFEVIACNLGVCTFRIVDNNKNNFNNRTLLENVNKAGRISLKGQDIGDIFCLQFISNQNMEVTDVEFAWNAIKEHLENFEVAS